MLLSLMSRFRGTGRAALASAGAVAIGVSSLFVVSGEAAASGVGTDENYSFAVSLRGSADEHVCGGVLIAKQWVLTAASCISDVPFTARIGSNSGSEIRGVLNTYSYPGWSSYSEPGGNDIGLVKLDRPSRMTPVPRATAAEFASSQSLRTLGRNAAEADKRVFAQPRQFDADYDRDGGACSARDLPQDEGFDLEQGICMSGSRGGTIENEDGGGAMLVKNNGEWKLAGVVSGRFEPWLPSAESPSWAGVNVFSSAHSSWIDHVTGV